MNGVGIAGSANITTVTNIFDGVNGTDSLRNACFTVSVTRINSPDRFPVKIVIDFGNDCTGRDGRTLKEKLLPYIQSAVLYPVQKPQLLLRDTM